MYFGNFNTPRFLEFLKYLNCKWIMSYDGSVSSERTNEDYSDNVPKELYTEKIMIKSGNSSFRRLTGNLKNTIHEALYIKN
jgi:DNA adenine methylase